MKHAAAIGLVILATAIAAAAADYSLTLAVGESTIVDLPGVTAAYAIDATIADASAAHGGVSVTARAAGTTQIVAVTGNGTRTIGIIVKPRAQAALGDRPGVEPPEHGTYDVRYTSSGGQIQNTVDLTRTQRDRREDAHLVTNTATGERFAGEPASVIRSISYRVTTPERQLTFFDSGLNHSPLTLDDTIVRGIHLRQDAWRLHAGYTTNALFGSLLLASERDLVIGGGYEYRLNERSRLMPSAFLYPDQHGGVVSLLYGYTRGEELDAYAELGYSHVPGGAAHIAYTTAQNRLRADVRYEPRKFDIVGPVTLHGLYSDASWSTVIGRRFSADAAGSINHYELPRFDQRSVTANVETRYAITRALAITAGVNYGRFSGTGVVGAVRSVMIPAGLQFDFGRFGGSAVYRYATNSATNRGGDGYRFTLRGSSGALYASAYFDYQTEAPTLQLILRDDPALSLALQQLGIVATTPEDIARALRSNAALINLGFIEGATVNLAPARTQAGFETSWLGSGAMRPQLRARILFNRTERVSSRVTTTLASLTWSQRLTAMTDVYAAVTAARTRTAGSQQTAEQEYFELGLRRRFDGLPHFNSSGTISGLVFLDEDMTGEPTSFPAADIDILLDGTRATRSDAAGRFAFEKVPNGAHRVDARVGGTAYFTTGSSVTAQPGDVVHFGVASTPARLVGSVADESGAPVANVTVTLTRGAKRFTGETRADGRFAIAAAPGEYEASVAQESLPPGVTFDRANVRRVSLERAKPLDEAFVVQINRSVGGHIASAKAGDVVTIPSLARKTTVDEEGRYLFRALPAGDITIVAQLGKQTLSTTVTLPHEAAALRSVDLGATGVASAKPAVPEPPPVVAENAPSGGTYVVQLGAFRNPAYAHELQQQARAAGVDTVIARRAELMLVQSEPYPSREAAAAEKLRIERAGFAAVVTKR